MNDEIKVILNYLDMYKNMNEGLLSSKDKNLLLDYITNLQEELDRCIKANVILDNQNAELQGKITNLQQKYDDIVSKYEKLLEKYFNILKGDSNE